MEIIKKHLTNGQYLTREYTKDSIFLHHTAGLNAEGAWQWWNQTPDRVGTPYIIDRDGKIVECFDPKNWAFHLGLSKDDNYHEMHSVNIELVSGGQLYEEQGEFRFYPLYPNKQFFTVIPKNEVITLDEPWRGFKFYHKYTDAQIQALRELIPYLVEMFPTIKFQDNISRFYMYDQGVVDQHQSGLWAHSTVRQDKTDIFPQPNFLKALKEIVESLSTVHKTATIPSTPKKPKTSKA